MYDRKTKDGRISLRPASCRDKSQSNFSHIDRAESSSAPADASPSMSLLPYRPPPRFRGPSLMSSLIEIANAMPQICPRPLQFSAIPIPPPPRPIRSHRYWFPDPHLPSFFHSPPASPLTLSRREISDKSANLNCRPPNLALLLFTNPHPLPPLVNISRRIDSDADLTRLGAPMFHFKMYRPCHYDCLPIEERIGSVSGTLPGRQWAQAACKSYQNMQ